MVKNINIYLLGKKYKVPDNLTIMKAFEYSGYKLTKGVGCRQGFCGACACIYRIKGERELHYALACETKVRDNMYVGTLPYFPLEKGKYNICDIKADEKLMMELYPEVYSCVNCNACTQSCPQGIDVRAYIEDAQNGDFRACAEKSFSCIMCGICSSRCPAEISHAEVAMLARRINGRLISPKSEHLENRVRLIKRGEFLDDVKALMEKSDDEILKDYGKRIIEA